MGEPEREEGAVERTAFWKGLALGIALTVLAAGVLAAAALGVWAVRFRGVCPMCAMMDRSGPSGLPGWMMSGGMDRTMMRDMHVIHELLVRHAEIRRRVEEIPGGVRTLTVSENPRVAALIRLHVRQMKERLEEGRPIREMDPLFREIFRRRREIRLRIEDVPGGVRVTETSENPETTRLIRQHARRAVSEFVAEGMARAMRPTPLPEGYPAAARPQATRSVMTRAGSTPVSR